MMVVGVVVGTGARAFQPYIPGENSPELAELKMKLAEREAHLARLEEEAALYAEAEVLGVTAAVQASQLPERALVAYNAGPGLAKKILAKRDARDRFMQGYPAKVMREFRRLKAQQARELTQLEEQKRTSGGPG
jgi:hypothetical protein